MSWTLSHKYTFNRKLPNYYVNRYSNPMSTSTAVADSNNDNNNSGSSNNYLSEEVVGAAAEIVVFDASGNRLKFGSLFELQKTVVVFIRHFFCGRCQQYVTDIANTPQELLERANINVVIIGCGDWTLIKNYRDLTFEKPNDRISIYAEPSRTLYRAMGMTTESLAGSPAGQAKQSYAKESGAKNALKSIMRALKHPSHIGKQGNISQLGGEFVLGPKYACSFSHLMENTEDHMEVADLLMKAGVSPEASS